MFTLEMYVRMYIRMYVRICILLYYTYLLAPELLSENKLIRLIAVQPAPDSFLTVLYMYIFQCIAVETKK